MRSVFDPSACDALVGRLRSLSADHSARWGRLNAPRMLCHVAHQLRCALGEIPTASVWTPLRNRALRYFAVHLLPWPKGRLPTAPEMLSTAPSTWTEDVAHVERLLAGVAKRGPAGTWPEHPAFGPLSGQEWGWLVYKHADHHLRQFSA